MRNHPSLARGTLIAACCLSAGCVATTPYLDSRFGEAVNLAKAQQTINPDASRNTNPVNGIDGASATETMTRYKASFKAPAPTTITNTINVGGGGTTMGGR